MPTGKQNKLSERLRSLEEIPEGFRFSPDNVWNRVEENLRRKKGKSLGWVYAAASLLVFFLVQTYWFNRKTPSTPPVLTEVNIGPSKDIPLTRVLPETKFMVPTSQPEIKKPGKPPMALQKSIIDNPVVPLNPDTGWMAAAPSPLPVTDTVRQKEAANAKTKYRYPIAHINELRNDPVKMPAPARKNTFAFRSYEVPEVPLAEESDSIYQKQKTIFGFLISQKQ